MPRDHRADAGMLHLDGNRTAGASLPSGRRDRLSSRVALLILILLFELSVVALPALARVPTRSAAAITETRLRAAPDRSAEPLLRLPEGATLRSMARRRTAGIGSATVSSKATYCTGDVATEPVIPTTDAQSGETHSTSRTSSHWSSVLAAATVGPGEAGIGMIRVAARATSSPRRISISGKAQVRTRR